MLGKLSKKELPLDYTPAFVSCIKKVTSKDVPEWFAKNYKINEHKEKNFCFSVRFNKPVFSKDKIILADENIHMVIDICDFSDGIDLYNAFVKNKHLQYPFPNGNTLTITGVKIDNHKTINSSAILIKMLSPLIVRINEENKNYYISCNDEEFGKYFSMSVATMLENLYGVKVEADSIKIFNDNSKKTVVNTFGNKITANVGTYVIRANSNILNVISQTGIGSRRSQGFGCFDVISEVM